MRLQQHYQAQAEIQGLARNLPPEQAAEINGLLRDHQDLTGMMEGQNDQLLLDLAGRNPNPERVAATLGRISNGANGQGASPNSLRQALAERAQTATGPMRSALDQSVAVLDRQTPMSPDALNAHARELIAHVQNPGTSSTRADGGVERTPVAGAETAGDGA